MPLLLLDDYNKLILKRPGITLLLVALIVTFFGYHTPHSGPMLLLIHWCWSMMRHCTITARSRHVMGLMTT